MLHPHQADTHPLCEGVSIRRWQMDQIKAQGEELLLAWVKAGRPRPTVANGKWIDDNPKIYTSRDNYGMGGVR